LKLLDYGFVRVHRFLIIIQQEEARRPSKYEERLRQIGGQGCYIEDSCLISLELQCRYDLDKMIEKKLKGRINGGRRARLGQDPLRPNGSRRVLTFGAGGE